MKLNESFEKDFALLVEEMSEYKKGCQYTRQLAVDKSGALHWGDILVDENGWTQFNFDFDIGFVLNEDISKRIKRRGIDKLAAEVRAHLEAGHLWLDDLFEDKLGYR